MDSCDASPTEAFRITRDRRTDGSVTFGLRVRVGGGRSARAPRQRERRLGRIAGGDGPKATAGKDRARTLEPRVLTRSATTTTRSPLSGARHRLARGSETEPSDPAENDRAKRLAAAALPNALLRRVAALHRSRPEKVSGTAVASTPRTRTSEPRPRQGVRSAIREPGETPHFVERVHQQDAPHPGIGARRGRRCRVRGSERGTGSPMREPLERRRPRGIIEVDEFLSLLDAAIQLDRERHRPTTLERAAEVRSLRDDAKLEWAVIAKQLRLARSTAFYLYACRDERTGPIWGARRPVIATLALAGPRVTELCQLNVDDLDLTKARFYVNDAKTAAGIASSRHPSAAPRGTDHLRRIPTAGAR